jgi:hypothetical protein
LGIERRGIITVKNSLLRDIMLNDLNSSSNTIRVIKSRRMGWAGQAPLTRAKRNA